MYIGGTDSKGTLVVDSVALFNEANEILKRTIHGRG
jgi:hypothetical protein